MFLPVPSPPPCHLPLPGKQKFLRAREVRGLHRPGQEPPGLLPARSLQWAAANPRETQIKSPPPRRAFCPLRQRCIWSPEDFYGFMRSSSNLLRTQSASKGPTQAHLLLLSWADPAWILNKLHSYCTWLWWALSLFSLPFFYLHITHHARFPCHGQVGLQSNPNLSFQRWN